MKILTTGGAGRLGAEVIKSLVAKKHHVIAFDLPSATWENLDGLDTIERIPGNITDIDSIYAACEGIDAIIHLAAILPPKSNVDHKKTLRINVDGTKNVISILQNIDKAKLLFASSISTYGITAEMKPPITENHPQKNYDFYSESKILAEKLIKNSMIPYVIFRIAPIAIIDLVELPEILPYRNDQRVEFIYIKDVARAFVSALKQSETIGRVFNIAGGKSWQMTGSKYTESFYNALGVDIDPIYSEQYTAIDWYDTRLSRFLNYQKTPINIFHQKLTQLAEEVGLI